MLSHRLKRILKSYVRTSFMSWQDDIRSERQRVVNQVTMTLDNNKIAADKLQYLWNKFNETNETLSSDIKLVLNKSHDLSDQSISSNGIIFIKNPPYHMETEPHIKVRSYQRIGSLHYGDQDMIIIYDLNANKYIGKGQFFADFGKAQVEIDDNSIDIILRNICTNDRPMQGLKSYTKPLSTKSKWIFAIIIIWVFLTLIFER